MERNEMIALLENTKQKKEMMDNYLAENDSIVIVMKAEQYEQQIEILNDALGISSTENIAEDIITSIAEA